MISPLATRSPVETMGRWLRQVPWLDRSNFFSGYSRTVPSSSRTLIMLDAQPHHDARFLRHDHDAGILGDRRLDAVATMDDSVLSRGTACRCMLEPIRARLVSSFSRKGMSAVATETSCLGETSM